MNYFYGLKTDTILSEIQIPKFQNKSSKSENVFLYELSIKNDLWQINRINECETNENFFILNQKFLDNEKIFFISPEKKNSSLSLKKLENFSDFTETWPAFRSNLKIFLKNGGFSSYQSEYPFSMIEKKGNILTPINILLDKNAEKNYLFIKNIYKEPVIQNFTGYIVNIKKKIILKRFKLKTNYSNIMLIDNDLIDPENYLITNEFLGIPMFISINKNHISFEHTHPPHEYILSKNKFEIIKNLKQEIYEIINKENS